MHRTPLYRLADLITGDIDEFVTTRREAGRSWRRISLDLYDATDRKIDVTEETLRGWFHNDDDGEGEAA